MSVVLKEKGRWDPLKVFAKVAAAYLVSKMPLRKEKRKIALIGGNLGEKYEDNAAIFHKYVVANHADKVMAYWMYDPKTAYALDGKVENAVPLGSFRNYVLFFQAEYTFHGHSLLYDIVPSADKFLFLNRKTIITHVSHGIEGFKKILIQKEDIPLLSRTNYFNCASEYEKELKRKEWKIPEEKLIVTGFPRFDRYELHEPAKEMKKILMMMTWREWLFELTEEEFLESAYFRNTIGLIQHQGIRELISQNGLHMEIALHPFMKKFEKHFAGMGAPFTGIEFLDAKHHTIEKAIEDNDMLITDISSVSWDFLYLNKPIIFNMFDRDEYIAKRGSYLDLEKDLYGYKADSIDEVYMALKRIVEQNITTNEWQPQAHQYIDYFDHQNCQRLAERVLEV
ncbi:CDP-glycerol glycerophosphotransferase family protein [Planococcus sp. APC 3906]|uniref:CDP-glycerol glycerophosphotransferase family protein n=1 Tax=Planococcus TaxID=1372 RepID=UPI0025B5ADA1|nr:CDP-glycerol glycerophosphotransferase family protein [Planococcus sp. APC 3906]MDN3449962.1 CDP-glycerol glycerophosphotransferase family protein [Planococcus sp. APC 3906]